ncbi:MAG: hypothetical protein ACOX4U_05065 [Anaerovoracaceae bacterium]|jgi:hypothetical protein
MKSSISKKKYLAIYRLLDRVSPVSFDCGTLCGAACCAIGNIESEKEDFELGIYLYPGEEKIFKEYETRKPFPSEWLDWSIEYVNSQNYPDSWSGGKVYFVRCKTPPNCPREYRPLQCRFFPLTPHIMGDGSFKLILFPYELPYECPLIQEKANLDSRFIKATYTVWKHLLRDQVFWDLVKFDSDYREEENLELHFIYP